jgi:peroxiredoxin
VSGPFVVSYVLLYAIVILQGMLLLGAARAIHELRQGHVAPEPEPGEPTSERLLGKEAPTFAAVDISGAMIGTEQLRGRSSVVLFVSPTCHSCMLTLDELNVVSAKVNGNVLVVCGARAEGCRSLARDYQLTVPVVVDEDARISTLFDVSSTPTAVLLNPGNRIVSYGHPMRGEELAEMMSEEAISAAALEGR